MEGFGHGRAGPGFSDEGFSGPKEGVGSPLLSIRNIVPAGRLESCEHGGQVRHGRGVGRAGGSGSASRRGGLGWRIGGSITSGTAAAAASGQSGEGLLSGEGGGSGRGEMESRLADLSTGERVPDVIDRTSVGPNPDEGDSAWR